MRRASARTRCIQRNDGQRGRGRAAYAPRCTTASHLTAAVKGLNGAATQFFFLVAFTNGGAVACSRSGAPQAQPVAGAKRVPVGPATQYRAVPNAKRETVVLHAGGTA